MYHAPAFQRFSMLQRHDIGLPALVPIPAVLVLFTLLSCGGPATQPAPEEGRSVADNFLEQIRAGHGPGLGVDLGRIQKRRGTRSLRARLEEAPLADQAIDVCVDRNGDDWKQPSIGIRLPRGQRPRRSAAAGGQ